MHSAAHLGQSSSIYAPPRHVTDPKDCYFYHTFDLPGVGLIEGSWDLRDDVDDYLGHVDLAGKRVLDVGSASGFLCFEMEKRGAEVVAYDLSDKEHWDLVPYAYYTGRPPSANLTVPGKDKPLVAGILGPDPNEADQKARLRLMNNGWWFVHQQMKSKARMVHGRVYDISDAVGPMDAALMGCILLHLENPFLALAKVCRLVRDTIIITEHDCHWPLHRPARSTPQTAPRGWRDRILGKIHSLVGGQGWVRREALSEALDAERETLYNAVDELPIMMFLPDSTNGPKHTWWYIRPAILRKMLGVLGFPHTTINYHTALYNGSREQLYTIVGKRAPSDKPQLRIAR